MNYKIKIETKCWDGDWEILLKSNRIQKLVEYNCYNFSNVSLLINNVQDLDKVRSYADKLVANSTITEYIIVEDFAKETLDFFNLSKASLGRGYYYSISELVGIYLSKEDYILHFSSDSFLKEKINWIDSSIKELNKINKVVNFVWNNKFNEAKNEAFDSKNDHYYSYGFSDQMYLIKTEDFKKPIYNEKNIESERYPEYGGELFEKRVDSWLRNNSFNRLTYKNASYFHKNYPKSKIKSKIKLLKGDFNL